LPCDVVDSRLHTLVGFVEGTHGDRGEGSGEDGHSNSHDENGCYRVGHRRDSCDPAQQEQTAGVNEQSAEDGKAGSDPIGELSDLGRS